MTLRLVGRTRSRFHFLPSELEYKITKPVYDLIFNTGFVQQKILDKVIEKTGEQITLERRYVTELEDGVYFHINTYLFNSPSGQTRNQIELSLQDYRWRGEQQYLIRISSHRASGLLVRSVSKVLVSALEEAKKSYETHVSERNTLAALALTGKDPGTRRGEALEIFAMNYYPESIRAASGAQVNVDDSSIPAMARQYSAALRNPQIDEVLFNR